MEELADLVFFLENAGKDPSCLIFDDNLTGLKNRRFFRNFFEFKIPWDALSSHPASMVMLDVDFLKDFNDQHGKERGDELLKYVAELVKNAAGEDNHPVRYGGDEFAILLPNQTKKKRGHYWPEAVKRSARRPLYFRRC